jgi:hypothetical protein
MRSTVYITNRESRIRNGESAIVKDEIVRGRSCEGVSKEEVPGRALSASLLNRKLVVCRLAPRPTQQIQKSDTQ